MPPETMLGLNKSLTINKLNSAASLTATLPTPPDFSCIVNFVTIVADVADNATVFQQNSCI
jgi:hypothetical protein